jgi:hypothetical protein
MKTPFSNLASWAHAKLIYLGILGACQGELGRPGGLSADRLPPFSADPRQTPHDARHDAHLADNS